MVRDDALGRQGFAILMRAKTTALDQVPPEIRREVVNGTASIEAAYNAGTIATLMDVPFSLLFLGVLYLITPPLALVTAGFCLFAFLTGVLNSRTMDRKIGEMQKESGVGSALLGTALREGDTIRCFNAGGFLGQQWQSHIQRLQALRRLISSRQNLIQTLTQSTNGLMGVVVIGWGAVLVVKGALDVGLLIGCNILASKALQPISRFAQLGSAFSKARRALETFEHLATVPLETESGAIRHAYEGRVELRDLAFAHASMPTPLFESLSVVLSPGAVCIVSGGNGTHTGKTTLARLMAGLLEPSRGHILVDGIDLKQVAPEWWRRQIIFLPQEPALLNATLAENIRLNRPDLEDGEMSQILEACGLRRFIDESPLGLQTPVVENGHRLAQGIRRRIAWARGLATSGWLVLLDEPIEGLDPEGRAAVNRILARLAESGRTLIILSSDPQVVRGSHVHIDLNAKPVPRVALSPATAPPAAMAMA
ncbi:MAG: ATP-binding cassette subfamily C bacterial LapB [Rhodospirillaceae bacterium]|nr:MAG: ATP-binding cassette subfamily C bacterial LapB [Rhodospirillaceae bacterium]